MTEIEEQAAQMRTMVWLEAEQRVGTIKNGGYPANTWKHPNSTQEGGAAVHLHRAVPPEIIVYADVGFNPGDRRSYALVSSWWDS